MLKQNWILISRLERLGDFIIIIACFFGAFYGRDLLVYWSATYNWQIPFGGTTLAPIKDYFTVLVVALIGYMIMLSVTGAYSSMRLSSTWRLLRLSLVCSVVVFFALAAVLYLLKLDLSRAFIIIFCGSVALTLTIQRYLTLTFLRFWRRRGKNFRNIIICGVGEQAARLAREISSRPELGIFVRAFADLKGDGSEDIRNFKSLLKLVGYRHAVRILTGNKAVESALKEYAIDEVIFTDVVEVMPLVEELIVVGSEQGVRTTIAADLFSLGMIKSEISFFGGMPLIHYQTPPGDRWELGVKRTFDLVAAALLLVVLAPVFLVVAIFIKLNSPGPVFFKQTRVGLNGRLFSLYKFRSMRQGAEGELAELKEQNEMVGPAFKIKNDPRVTAVGRLLRRFSLDELPQLWNVIRGDMSLVGPRPPVPGEVNLYERRNRRRLSMRPGMTCTWQVSGRSNISDFESWVKLDLEYIDNWSLGRDFVLLFRTIPAVLFGVGAR